MIFRLQRAKDHKWWITSADGFKHYVPVGLVKTTPPDNDAVLWYLFLGPIALIIGWLSAPVQQNPSNQGADK